MESVLVTGATGFIGGHVAGRLVALGYPVRVLVRDRSRLGSDLAGRVEVVEGSLADRAALARAVAGVERIFHCAADVKTWDRRENYLAANVEGVANLLAAIGEKNPGLRRLVHLSTVDVYGFPERPCDEDAPLVAAGFGYGDSKLRGECLLRERATQLGIPTVILRPANVFGPGSPFVDRVGEALEGGLMLKVDGGRAHAGVVDVDTVVAAMLWASDSPVAAGRCYNVRDDGDATWAQVIEVMQGHLGRHGLTVNLPFSVAEVAARACEMACRIALPQREPLLHPLVVRIFGRTCGHLNDRLRADGGLVARSGGIAETIARSMAWYRESRSGR